MPSEPKPKKLTKDEQIASLTNQLKAVDEALGFNDSGFFGGLYKSGSREAEIAKLRERMARAEGKAEQAAQTIEKMLELSYIVKGGNLPRWGKSATDDND